MLMPFQYKKPNSQIGDIGIVQKYLLRLLQNADAYPCRVEQSLRQLQIFPKRQAMQFIQQGAAAQVDILLEQFYNGRASEYNLMACRMSLWNSRETFAINRLDFSFNLSILLN